MTIANQTCCEQTIDHGTMCDFVVIVGRTGAEVAGLIEFMNPGTFVVKCLTMHNG